jgi:toxin ParE1/3/4
MRYEFHPEAEQELYESAFHYEAVVPELGRRFGGEVERVIQFLLENPETGSYVDEDLRHFVLRRFPFSVVYFATSELLYVVAVAHGSREPGYWRFRVHDR